LTVTAVGFVAAIAAAACLWFAPELRLLAAGFIALAWLCDRTDGALARLQHSATPLGAWIDANVDECVDLGLHVVTAAAAARSTETAWPWACLIGFLVGKYLLMHGLASHDDVAESLSPAKHAQRRNPRSVVRRLYHLPGNADVRLHLLLAAVATGWLTCELAIVAVYYNLRWLARYGLLARRLSTRPASGVTV
jgi:hypothetical protein